MKSFKNILSITLILAFTLNCKNEIKPVVKTIEVEAANELTKKLDPNATYAKAEFTIDGMTCAVGCAATIQKSLGKMDGVKSAIVDFDKRIAMVEYDLANVTTTSLEEAVTKVSETYKVSDMKTVDTFSTEKKENQTTCEPNCEKKCCKTIESKMICLPTCKEACCAKA